MTRFTDWLVLLLCCAAISCRAIKDPEDQNSAALTLPGYPEEENSPAFGLSELGLGSRNFNGWLILFDQNARREDLAEVIQSTTLFHRYYAQYLAHYAKRVAPLRLVRAELLKQQSELTNKADAAFRLERWRALGHWVVDKLASSPLNLEGPELASSKENFSLFCDAKVWEFATTRSNLQSIFLVRPTPAVVCEEYYSAQGYFSDTSASCSNSPIPKDFFSCIWREGVVKTGLFHRINDFHRLAAVSDDMVRSTILSTLISQAILGQRRPVRIDGEMFDLTFPGMTFISSNPLAKIRDLTVSGILQTYALEHSSDITAVGCQLVSTFTPRADVFIQALEGLRKDIRVMTGEFDDLLFNKQEHNDSAPSTGELQSTGSAYQTCANLGGGEICAALNGTDTETNVQLAIIAEKLQDIESSIRAEIDQVESPCADNQASPSLRCLQKKSSLRLAEAVTQPGVAVLVLPLQRFGLQVRSSLADGSTVFELSLASIAKSSADVFGCIDLNNKNSTCQPPIPQSGRALTSLSVSTGDHENLLVSWPSGENPSNIGLASQPFLGDRHSPEFIALTEQQLKMRRFEISLFPRRWEGVLEALLGEVKVKSPTSDIPEYQGMALLMDSDVSTATAHFVQ